MARPMLGMRLGPRLCAQNGGFRVAINEDVRKTVVFFGKQIPPKPGSSDPATVEVGYGGTGFLVEYVERGQPFKYLVTCRHVAEQLDVDFFLRVNTLREGVANLPIEVAEWEYHPDEAVDLAATDIGLNALHFDVLSLPLSNRTTASALGCGQRVHIVGLFRLHYGEKRNVPMVHTGHIAALPDSNEKVPIKNRSSGQILMAEAYLVEAQTLEGLSGSPVFVQEYVAWNAINKSDGSNIAISAFGSVRLLGVYQGAWDARPGEILAADRNLSGTLRVPVGMGIVVPIERVVELIERNETLKTRRETVIQLRRERTAATMDSAFSSSSGQETNLEDNPDHREDFNRLVSAASKRKPKGDRT